MSSRKYPSNDKDNEDESSTFHLCLEDSEKESCTTFDDILSESLKLSKTKDK